MLLLFMFLYLTFCCTCCPSTRLTTSVCARACVSACFARVCAATEQVAGVDVRRGQPQKLFRHSQRHDRRGLLVQAQPLASLGLHLPEVREGKVVEGGDSEEERKESMG